MEKDKTRTIFTIIVAVLIAIAMLSFIFSSVLLIVSLVQASSETKGYFISIFSAIIGGICTLGGVLVTYFVDRNRLRQKMKTDTKPEIFVPGNYDFALATRIRMVDGKGTDDFVPNYHIVLKNSDKAPFVIEKMKADESSYLPTSVTYIEKDLLFYLSFYGEQRFKNVTLYIKSMGGYSYCLKCSLDVEGNAMNESLEEVCK